MKNHLNNPNSNLYLIVPGGVLAPITSDPGRLLGCQKYKSQFLLERYRRSGKEKKTCLCACIYFYATSKTNLNYLDIILYELHTRKSHITLFQTLWQTVKVSMTWEICMLKSKWIWNFSKGKLSLPKNYSNNVHFMRDIWCWSSLIS